MVLENVRVGLIGEVFDGTSGLGLLVMSCLFGLGSLNWDYSPNVRFLGEGANNCCCTCPTYRLPIARNMSFFDT